MCRAPTIRGRMKGQQRASLPGHLWDYRIEEEKE